MSSTPTILLVGLPWDHALVAAQTEITTIRDGLAKATAVLKDAGCDFHAEYAAPDDAAWQAKMIAALKERKYDAVVVGFGVRGVPGLTVFFEAIVNTVVEYAPGAKLLFNSTPETTVDAVKRWFPIA